MRECKLPWRTGFRDIFLFGRKKPRCYLSITLHFDGMIGNLEGEVCVCVWGGGGCKRYFCDLWLGFLKCVICEKANEKKSATCDRGIVCDLWRPNKNLCDLWICKIICLRLVILEFSVAFSVIVIEASGSLWFVIIDFKSLWFVTRPPRPRPPSQFRLTC